MVETCDAASSKPKQRSTKVTLHSEMTYPTQAACIAAIEAAGLPYDSGRFGSNGVAYARGVMRDGKSVFQIAIHNEGKPNSVGINHPAVKRAEGEKGPVQIVREFMTENKGIEHKAAIDALVATGLNPSTVKIQLKRQGWF